MITEENWINFIQTFFGASNASTEWIHHVAAGWNHNKNEAGCHCSYTWYSGPVECDVYTGIKNAKEQFELANTSDVPVYEDDAAKPVNLAGVESYIERGSEGDFFEEDEPVADVVAAFEGGEKGTTGKSLPAEDYLDALKPEADAPNLKSLAKDYMDAQAGSKLPLSEITQVLPPYAEVDIKFAEHMAGITDTGAHPKLKDLVAEYKATTKSGQDEEQNVKDFEEDGPGHGYWEKGDH